MDIDDDTIPAVPLTDDQRARFEAAADRALEQIRARRAERGYDRQSAVEQFGSSVGS